MSSLLRTLTLGLVLLLLSACGGGETTTTSPADTAATNAATASKEVAEVICCNGKCDAPKGYCCSDGTCHGSHSELPLARSL